MFIIKALGNVSSWLASWVRLFQGIIVAAVQVGHGKDCHFCTADLLGVIVKPSIILPFWPNYSACRLSYHHLTSYPEVGLTPILPHCHWILGFLFIAWKNFRSAMLICVTIKILPGTNSKGFNCMEGCQAWEQLHWPAGQSNRNFRRMR